VSHPCPNTRVLSVFPSRLGFSYAVLEGHDCLVEWDAAQLGKHTDEEFGNRVEEIIKRFKPTLLTCEDCAGTRRGEKAQRRVEAVIRLAKLLDIDTLVVSPADIDVALDLPRGSSKHEIAMRIVQIFPELARKAPRRRIWQRDPRMNLFEAVALGLAAGLYQTL
jgi:hypothetical protein